MFFYICEPLKLDIYYILIHSRKIRVTKELLLKMFEHKFELKMWDTKDKVSAKARFDRPKAFRLPQTKNHDEVDLEAIRSMLKQAGKETIHLGSGSSSLVSQSKGLSLSIMFLFYLWCSGLVRGQESRFDLLFPS